MKPLIGWTAILIVLGGFHSAGCSKVPPPLKPVTTPVGPRGPADPFQAFLDNTRFPDNPRPGDDWTRYKINFEPLNPYFAKPDVRANIQLDDADRKFLKSEAHLSDSEIAEIESSSFRSPDAHYLDECFLLHDAARSLHVSNLTPAQQADADFRWVMRNVLLHEQGDTWVPPAFTLRRGYGNALERALVFLALLRQSRMEGCLIVVPETTPHQLLVGAIDAKAEDILLFDPRLGLPLKSKDRKHVLTLKEALADPTLLQPARITPEDAKKLEAWLVCPLFALAPRMMILQSHLNEPITLHLDAKSLRDQVAAVTTLPVKVWNPPAKGNDWPNSPTRCLRLFLPQEDGGLDATNRAELWARRRIPTQSYEVNLAKIHVTKDLLPPIVMETLLPSSSIKELWPNKIYAFSGIDLFFEKFDMQARELYLRGQYDTVIRRQERLKEFLRDDTLAGLAQDSKFLKDLGDWQNYVQGVLTSLENPQMKDQKQKVIQELIAPDDFMKWMLEGAAPVRSGHVSPHQIWIDSLDRDRPLEKDPEKERKKISMLSKIQTVGMREYFVHELARSQALTSHERAARAQASVAAASGPSKVVLGRASDAWKVARDSWFFYLEPIALSDTIERRLAQFRERIRADPLEMFDVHVSLLESLHLDIHKYFQAKLSLADCKVYLEDKKKVQAYLGELKSEIEDLKKKGQVEGMLKVLREVTEKKMSSPERARFAPRLELLDNDWAADGAYAWMLRAIDARLAATQ